MLVQPPKNFLVKNFIPGKNLDDIYKNYAIEIDNCLVEEIQELWKKGIHTLGCCCGHFKNCGFIQVERTDLGKMLELGYEWYTDYPKSLGGESRLDAFIPKSPCNCIKKEKIVTFINSKNEERKLDDVNSIEEAYAVIKKFLEEHNYKSYYTKINLYSNFLLIDVGSHTEFFKIYDNGIWR